MNPTLFFKPNAKSDGEAGLGMIEIVMVVAVSMIIVSISMVIFGNARARYELSNRAQEFVWHIERARSIAIAQNRTITLGFSSENKIFGINCDNCQEAKDQLPPFSVPGSVKLTVFPVITIKGNGTVEAKDIEGKVVQSWVLEDKKGRRLPITLNNSGRIVVGEIIVGSTS